ncbi:class III poly(R)-hydroxyalkanoic acid synthase subunit PhaC [[Eubacterium] cellulosolvens]
MLYNMLPLGDFLSFQKVVFEKIIKNNHNLLKATQIMSNPPEVDVGTTPADIDFRINNIKLLHYKPLTDNQEPVPVLIIYALINKPYILDLQPDRSVVKFFLENGFDVYLIDWGEPREMDHILTVNDYVNNFIDKIVDHILREKGIDQLSILGYCMGGTLSTMYVALHPYKVKNFMAMAAPIYFKTDESLLHVWAIPEYFDVDHVVDTLGNIPPDFLNGGYLFLDPIGNIYSKYIKFLDSVDNEDFVRMFLRMEKWINDGIPLAGETFREFIKNGYQQNLLVKNEWKLNGNTVDLRNITMPVLNIIGDYDHLVPPTASKPLLDYVGSNDKKELLLPTGHIGLSVSSKSHRILWPQVAEWLRPRSQLESGKDEESNEVNPPGKGKKGGGRRGGRRGSGTKRGKKK